MCADTMIMQWETRTLGVDYLPNLVDIQENAHCNSLAHSWYWRKKVVEHTVKNVWGCPMHNLGQWIYDTQDYFFISSHHWLNLTVVFLRYVRFMWVSTTCKYNWGTRGNLALHSKKGKLIRARLTLLRMNKITCNCEWTGSLKTPM